MALGLQGKCFLGPKIIVIATRPVSHNVGAMPAEELSSICSESVKDARMKIQ